jgi:hypothetical protein
MKSLKDFVGGVIPHSLRSHSNPQPGRKATANVPQTPLSNTGYDSQPFFSAAVDWIDFTFRLVSSETAASEIIGELEALATDSVDFSFDRSVFNGRSWDGSGSSSRGIRLWWDAGNDAIAGGDMRSPQLKISMSGKVMGAIDFAVLADWLSYRAASNELDCTRIDICLDDHRRIVPMGKITEVHYAGNFFNAKYSKLESSSNRGDNQGITVYFGHPQSLKRLRIYDKTIESKGAIDAIRWEAQYRKGAAREVLFQVLEEIDESVERATKYFAAIVVGVIDFRLRDGNDPNRARCKPLSWFVAFCDAVAVEPIRIKLAIVPLLIQRSINWLEKSVAQSIALVAKTLNEDWAEFAENLLSQGAERLNNRKREIILSTNKQQLIY